MNSRFGNLYLIPTLLGATTAEQVIPQGTLDIVRKIRFFVVENIRTARRMLSKMNMPCPIDELTFVELDKHDKSNNPDLMTYLGEALNGNDVGLMSEAGTPCVADPGSLIVGLAHQAGIKVVPLTGPNAMILALMALISVTSIESSTDLSATGVFLHDDTASTEKTAAMIVNNLIFFISVIVLNLLLFSPFRILFKSSHKIKFSLRYRLKLVLALGSIADREDI